MKINKILLSALFASLFVSCANDDNDSNGVSFPTEVEDSYIAVNVKGNNGTRATDGGFDEGEGGESTVNSVHFFFFDASGNPFPINESTLTPGEAPSDKNYYIKSVGTTPSTGNVENISDAVIVLQNAKGKLPEKMVAVVNFDYNGDAINHANLKAELVDAATAAADGEFVMSNSVYLYEGEVYDATPITLENIAASEDIAKQKPVDIYVERVAAKVTVKSQETKFDTGIQFNGNNVYAVVQGWALNTTMSHSSLIKSIDASWSATGTPGFAWNDAVNYRSYWSQSVAADGTDVTLAKSFKLNDINGTNLNKSLYCLENTAAAGLDNSDNTKVIVAVKYEANNSPVEIVQLLSEYMTIEGLKNTIANSLSAYWYEDGANKVKLTPECVELVASTENSYEMTYKLTAAAEALTWHKSSDNGNSFAAETAANINAYMATFHAAKVWKDGGYYFLNVEHLKDGLAGVVRNHSYEITVDGVTGLGTPVYDGAVVIPEPVKPTEDESFIAARVNVLSWKVVSQNVTLN